MTSQNSMVNIRPPFCGYDMMELMDKDLTCYLYEIQTVSLRKCPHDHHPTDKGYLSDIRVTNNSKTFAHKKAAKSSWHRYGTKLRHSHPM